jgi:SNF2 family DNA or RNA helicase
MPVWERQFKEHSDFPIQITLMNEGSLQDKSIIVSEIKNAAEPCLQTVIVNYDSMWRGALNKALEKYVKHDAMIILDESQRIKNRTTEAAKACIRLGDICKYKMILTGTPVTQSPLDFFSQYKFLDSEIFGTRYSNFEQRYCVKGGFNNYEIVDYNNLEELARKAHSIAYRCTKDECLDLPDTIDQIEYTMLKDSREMYDTMERDFIVSLDNGMNIQAPVVLSQILRLQQITGGFLPLHDQVDKTKIVSYQQVGHEKLDVLKDLLEDINKKVVIFCRFKPELRTIEDILTSMGKGVLTLSGETPADRRGKICDLFQHDKGVDAIVAQIQVGGSGIDLYAADTMIFYSMDYSYADYEQAKARIHRMGQKSDHCTYIHLIAKNTIDEDILKAVQSKGDIAQLVVDKMKGKYR